MNEAKQEIIAALSKVWVWLFYIVIGIIGKVSYDMLQGRKMTWVQIFGAIGISLFCGIVASAICHYKGLEDAGKFIVPIATLLSEKIALALFSVDYNKMLVDFVSYWRKDK